MTYKSGGRSMQVDYIIMYEGIRERDRRLQSDSGR